MNLGSVRVRVRSARTTYPIFNRDASADDVHSLAGNGPGRINLFHKKRQGPLSSSLVLLRDYMFFLSKYIYKYISDMIYIYHITYISLKIV